MEKTIYQKTLSFKILGLNKINYINICYNYVLIKSVFCSKRIRIFMGLFKNPIHLDFTQILWTKYNENTD